MSGPFLVQTRLVGYVWRPNIICTADYVNSTKYALLLTYFNSCPALGPAKNDVGDYVVAAGRPQLILQQAPPNHPE